MNVNDSNLLRTPGQSTIGSSEVTKSTPVTRSTPASITPDSAGDGDGVQLSALSRNLSSLNETPEGISETGSAERDAQVQALADAYARGTYQADPDATADALVRSLAAGA